MDEKFSTEENQPLGLNDFEDIEKNVSKKFKISKKVLIIIGISILLLILLILVITLIIINSNEEKNDSTDNKKKSRNTM